MQWSPICGNFGHSFLAINKSGEKINVNFVISTILTSFWNASSNFNKYPKLCHAIFVDFLSPAKIDLHCCIPFPMICCFLWSFHTVLNLNIYLIVSFIFQHDVLTRCWSRSLNFLALYIIKAKNSLKCWGGFFRIQRCVQYDQLWCNYFHFISNFLFKFKAVYDLFKLLIFHSF